MACETKICCFLNGMHDGIAFAFAAKGFRSKQNIFT